MTTLRHGWNTRLRPPASVLAGLAVVWAALIGFAAFTGSSIDPPLSVELSSAAPARWEQPLGLGTPSEQAEALARIRNQLPAVLSGAATYDRDLLGLLGLQHAVVRDLIDDPVYRALSAQRSHGLIDIEVGVKIGSRPAARNAVPTIDRSAIESWKAGLLGSFESVVDDDRAAADGLFVNALLRALKSGAVGRPGSIVEALVTTLPPERRKDALARAAASQPAAFAHLLPKELISAGFPAGNFGWTDPSLDASTVLSRLAAARDAEGHVLHLLQIHLLLQGGGQGGAGRLAGRAGDVGKRLASLDEGSFSSLIRSDDLARELAALRKTLLARDKTVDEPFRAAVRLLKERVRRLSADAVATNEVFDERLVLKEAPPLLAAFRGFVGNDGATERSSIYANSPNERVFLIFDRLGNVKGYAAGTVVVSGARRLFYAHTINGPNLSAAAAEAILLAFKRSSRELNVADVVIPSAHAVFAKMNYASLRAAYEKASTGRSVAIQHPDAPLRAKFARLLGSPSGHDGPEANSQARLVWADGPAAGDTVVRVGPGSLTAPVAGAVSGGDLAILAVSLELSGRGSGPAWSEVLRAGGFTERDVREASAAMRNEHQLPIEEFRRALGGTLLGRLGVRLDDASMARDWPLFIMGQMNAVDALEPRNAALTKSFVSAAIAREAGDVVGRLLDLHGPYVLSEPGWRERIARSDGLITEIMPRLGLLDRWPAELKAEIAGKIREREPRLLEFHRTLAAAGTSAEFLARVPPGRTDKAAWVRLGVRSALDHFLSMGPNAEEVRRLAQWMHDYDEIALIKERALARSRGAGEFLRVSDDDDGEAPAFSRVSPRKTWTARLTRFMNLNPTVEQVNAFRRRARTIEDDLEAVRRASARLDSAGDFLKLTGFRKIDRAGADDPHSRALRRHLEGSIEAFARLEPTSGEVNEFRRQLFHRDGDFRLMELVAPKITKAGDFLEIVRMYDDVRAALPDAYSKRTREFVDAHVDMFLNLRPTPSEVNAYRRRTMSPATDLALLSAALQAPASAGEMVELLDLHGENPPGMGAGFVARMRELAEANVDRFLGRAPNAEQVAAYRKWTGDPGAELKLVDAGIRLATSKEDVLRHVARRMRARTAEADRAWAALLEREFPRFLKLSPTGSEVDLYLRNFGDAAAIARLNAYRRSLETAPSTWDGRVRSWFGGAASAP